MHFQHQSLFFGFVCLGGHASVALLVYDTYKLKTLIDVTALVSSIIYCFGYMHCEGNFAYIHYNIQFMYHDDFSNVHLS